MRERCRATHPGTLKSARPTSTGRIALGRRSAPGMTPAKATPKIVYHRATAPGCHLETNPSARRWAYYRCARPVPGPCSRRCGPIRTARLRDRTAYGLACGRRPGRQPVLPRPNSPVGKQAPGQGSSVGRPPGRSTASVSRHRYAVPFESRLMGMLAEAGGHVVPGQLVAWLRVRCGASGAR